MRKKSLPLIGLRLYKLGNGTKKIGIYNFCKCLFPYIASVLYAEAVSFLRDFFAA